MASVHLRDIPLQIEIQDSCNCRCCFPWWRKNKPAYVTRSYVAEPFSPVKSTDEEHDKRESVDRIRRLIDIMHQHQLIPEKIEVAVEPADLTFRDVERINREIRRVMKLKEGGS